MHTKPAPIKTPAGYRPQCGKYALIRGAYRILGDTTPIPADCGKLCGAACCKGDGETGMLLFPGEAPRLAKIAGFRVLRIDYMDTRQWLLICEGTCDRNLRPLSCRIFPLAPKVHEDGSVTARLDPRAMGVKCPLAIMRYLDSGFTERVSRVFSLLGGDPQCLAFMRAVSGELDELEILGLRQD